MACNTVTLTPIFAKCDMSIGGIKRILIAQKEDVQDIIVDWDENTQTGSDMVTEITMKEGKFFVEWLFRKNTANYSTSMSSDAAIGNSIITTDLNLQFTKAEATKRLSIQSAINAAAVVIMEDMYGQYILLGKDNEVTVTSVNQQSGTAMTDLNGYTLTFQDTSARLPHFIDTETVDVSTLLKTTV